MNNNIFSKELHKLYNEMWYYTIKTVKFMNYFNTRKRKKTLNLIDL